NGDGHLDLSTVTVDGDLAVLLGNGDGSFQPAKTFATGEASYSVSALVAGDFNGDGHLDLAASGYNAVTYADEVAVLLGNGDGAFQPAKTSPADYPWSLVAGDFNGDGELDLAQAGGYPNTVSVLLGNGDGTFQIQKTFTVGSSPLSIVAGDFNGDGR